MKEIACMSGVELLMDFLEGVLPPDVHAALEAHVAGCARCAAFVESYRATPRILRDATATPLPDHVEASLKAFLRARTDSFK
jgi:anti-sigma factor RsiW